MKRYDVNELRKYTPRPKKEKSWKIAFRDWTPTSFPLQQGNCAPIRGAGRAARREIAQLPLQRASPPHCALRTPATRAANDLPCFHSLSHSLPLLFARRAVLPPENFAIRLAERSVNSSLLVTVEQPSLLWPHFPIMLGMIHAQRKSAAQKRCNSWRKKVLVLHISSRGLLV